MIKINKMMEIKLIIMIFLFYPINNLIIYKKYSNNFILTDSQMNVYKNKNKIMSIVSNLKFPTTRKF